MCVRLIASLTFISGSARERVKCVKNAVGENIWTAQIHREMYFFFVRCYTHSVCSIPPKVPGHTVLDE